MPNPETTDLGEALERARVWLDHGRASFGATIPVAALEEVIEFVERQRSKDTSHGR